MAKYSKKSNEEKESKEEMNIEKYEEQTVIEQIEAEYQLSYQSQESKIKENLKRLRLFNNQAREKSKVGDPLLFTVFQTVLSALYEDRLNVSFEGNEEGDQETAENLTDLATHDYSVMGKDQVDYEWDWDSLFFGRGLLLLNEFDRTKGVMAPVPEVIDPMTFLRDPNATSVNGDMRGRGAMRFGGREVGLSMWQMKDLESKNGGKDGGFFNLDKIKKGKDLTSLNEEAKQLRKEAQGNQNLSTQEETLDENYEYTLLEWFTHIDGEKCIVTTANSRDLIVRKQKIEGNKWPIIDRPLFPMAHDWDGVSIPDLIEDKQRARAKMLNLGMDAAIADLHPMYLYNKKKIRNKRDLDFAFNKAVGVDGDVNNAYMPMQKANTVTSQTQSIFNLLDVAAQKAVAAPEIAQGVAPTADRTLGETELVAAGRGARMSLAAAIWGWSDKDFWRQWYWLYKKHFSNDIDEKIIRIKSPLSTKWRKLTKENLIAEVDPDIYIESARISASKKQRDYVSFSNFAQVALQDPQTNRRYLMRRMGKLQNLKNDELMLLFPPTPDEILAEDENENLIENKFVKGNHFDDHIVHLEIHRKAGPTPAALAHIEFHKQMIKAQKEFPEAFPKQGQPEIESATNITTPEMIENKSRGQMMTPQAQQEVL